MNKKKPKFKRQHSDAKKRVQGKGWRHPRGIDSEQREHLKSRGKHPRIGYGSPKSSRGLHPTGVKEVMVKTLGDLAKVGEGMAARLYSKLGKRKRAEIVAKAKEKKVRVLN
ncbi:MAG: 50S ribosomal protein L32e [Candidatus Diapherotrites archaeon]|nr:50S ribosomal protein L32e [Candidatus Diapherotrites archaeon]